MNDNLNRILGELEEDLKKLQSAREQVERVIESSNNFAGSANSLISNSQRIIDSISNITKGAVEEFTKKINNSNNDIDKVVNQSINHLDAASKRIENAIIQVANVAKTNLEEQKNENLKVLNQLLETQNQLKRLTGELLSFELPNTLKEINANLKIISEENNVKFESVIKRQNVIFFGVVITIVIIMLFIFK